MEELRRMNTDFDSAFPEEEKKEDSRSMLEVMREKNAKAEADLAAQKSKGESMEERKARLLAQRDMLRKMKEEKRQQELADFNNQMNADPLIKNTALGSADDFKRMDTNKVKTAD